MDISFLTVQVLSALRQAAFLFLISSGLTLVFGVLNILNFAHGSLYMLGAYLVYGITLYLVGPAGFFLALLLAPLGVAAIAALIEIVLLRRIYIQEEIYQLLLTFSLVLIIDDLAKIIFGAEYKSIPKPHFLSGSFQLFGATVPNYTAMVLIAAPLVALAMWHLLYRTKTGKVVRATSSDREMADALGINMTALFTLVFAFGAMLAGFAGALAGPVRTVFPGLGTEVIIECFVVVVIGGLGSLWGAFIGSLLIGTLETVGIIVFPQFEMGLIYLLMVVVLIVRPWGLFGKPMQIKSLSEKNLSMEAQEISPVHFSSPLVLRLLPLIVLLVIPLVTGRYYQYLLTQIFVAALMAISFNLLLGTTGLLSFGQAAFFGVGAYTVGLLLTKTALGTLPVLGLAIVISAAVAAAHRDFLHSPFRGALRHAHPGFRTAPLCRGLQVVRPDGRRQRHPGNPGAGRLPGEFHLEPWFHQGNVLLRPRRGGVGCRLFEPGTLVRLWGHAQVHPGERPEGRLPGA